MTSVREAADTVREACEYVPLPYRDKYRLAVDVLEAAAERAAMTDSASGGLSEPAGDSMPPDLLELSLRLTEAENTREAAEAKASTLEAWSEEFVTALKQLLAMFTEASFAAAAAGAADSIEERWPCGCVKGEAAHGVGWRDCAAGVGGTEKTG